MKLSFIGARQLRFADYELSAPIVAPSRSLLGLDGVCWAVELADRSDHI